MDFQVVTRRAGRTAVLVVHGDLDLRAAPTLAAAVAVARIEHPSVVVDLTDVAFIDSSGLRELLGQAMVTQAAGRSLALVEPGPNVSRLFDLTGTRGRFTWVPRPNVEAEEALPDRVTRHQTALAAIGQLAGEASIGDVARLVSDAVGDACIISVVDAGTVRPIAIAHREREAEDLLRRALAEPLPIEDSPVFCQALTGTAVFLDPGGASGGFRPATRRVHEQAPIGAVACLPLAADGGDVVTGFLGVSRDAGRGGYDAQDRRFLVQVAATVGAAAPFCRPAVG